ncbi:LytR/AlgR family response regulator transcription factor [Vagococcus sp. JNUCC 83]
MHIFFKQNKQLSKEDINIQIESAEHSDNIKQLKHYIRQFNRQQLIISSEGRYYTVDTKNILFIDVLGDFCTIHLNDRSLTYRKSLSQLEAELPKHHFERISRYSIINLNSIHHIDNSLSGNMSVQLINGESLTISRRYWKKVKERLLNHD